MRDDRQGGLWHDAGMIIQSFPDLTQEEYERRCRAMEEAGRKIRQSRSSALAHLIGIGAVDSDRTDRQEESVATRTERSEKPDSHSAR